MNEDYCDYKLSLALKACGFDEPCGKSLKIIPGTEREEWDEEECQWCTVQDIEYYPKISLWQAQKWLREKKELCVTVYAQPYNGLPYYTGYILFEGDEKEVLDQDGHWYDDYEQCLSDTISAALELIKKGE